MNLPTFTPALKEALAKHDARQVQAKEIQDGTFIYLEQAQYCVDCSVYLYEDETEYLIEIYKCKEEPECYNMSFVNSQAECMKHEDYELMQKLVYTSSKDAQKALSEILLQNSLFAE